MIGVIMIAFIYKFELIQETSFKGSDLNRYNRSKLDKKNTDVYITSKLFFIISFFISTLQCDCMWYTYSLKGVGYTNVNFESREFCVRQ